MDRKGSTGDPSLVQSLSRDVGEEEEGTREVEMGCMEEAGRAEDKHADLLIHWSTLVIISNEKCSSPLLRAVSLSTMK